jgi:hypothetical protein
MRPDIDLRSEGGDFWGAFGALCNFAVNLTETYIKKGNLWTKITIKEMTVRALARVRKRARYPTHRIKEVSKNPYL